MMHRFLLVYILSLSITAQGVAPDSLKNISLAGLKFRSIGPAVTGGRIVDLAIHPTDPAVYFVASGHGSLWKTENHGTTFKPAFDGQKSFAIGAVRIDPVNPDIVWVGTGEHNNQSNVIYGDGVYRSEDGGKSWKNMGLGNSEHIGGIAIDPVNSDIVYVAAYGSTRIPGTDRGVYKTTDGGKTWEQILFVNDHTGCFEIHMDPSNSQILYVSMHQRMRADYTVLRGGPESAIYRTLNGGRSWEKVMKGISAPAIGRIGLSISPASSNVLYACVEAPEKSGGLFISRDRGSSWTKQSEYSTAYPFYMQKIVADPKDVNTVYGLDLHIMVSRDAGKTFMELGEKLKHVDNHALWIDPKDTRHMISGCDGGVYETWDAAQNWDFKSQLPIAEIYKVSTDNALPFYNVYIGTQDNLSLFGPSQTRNSSGITNADWTFTNPGDGFESQADWSNDRFVYAQAQHGWLVRYDKLNGERLLIQPQNEMDSAYRFDWDSPLLISAHNPKRLYFAANKLFRTDDMGHSWTVISPDLTWGVPQKMNRIAGKSWSVDDMISKGSQANISTIAESRINPFLLFVGSADGLIHYSTNGGNTWQRSVLPTAIAEGTRIHHITASQHSELVAYAACQALNSGNYKPLLLKTTDGGKTWHSISSNLPARGSTYCIAEDHQKPGLLFTGTQFGLYFSVDDGSEWIRLQNGLPNTTIMDLEIQRREQDLVVSTFGRGVYILDDYSPLRELNREMIKDSFKLFPIPEARMYISANPFGYGGTAFQGASYFSAPNPEQGATFTYYVRDAYQSLKEQRNELEKKLKDSNKDIVYPGYDVLLKEKSELKPYLLFVVSDETGAVVRKIRKDWSKGLQRFTWDLRFDDYSAYDEQPNKGHKGRGFMVSPGIYYLSVHLFDGRTLSLPVERQAFSCVPLYDVEFADSLADSLKAFNQRLAELLRVVSGAEEYRLQMKNTLSVMRRAIEQTHLAPLESELKLIELEQMLEKLDVQMNGDPLRSRYEGASAPNTRQRLEHVSYGLWSSTSMPTQTYIRAYELARNDMNGIINELHAVDQAIRQLNLQLDQWKVPYTPGRLPFFRE